MDNCKEFDARLYESLLKTRSVIISGEINQELAGRVAAQLLLLQSGGDEPIRLYINSQGGHVEAGDTIHDMIKFVSPRVIIIGTGWVASAGALIYLAAEKRDRLCLPNTRFMIHQPAGGVSGQTTDIKIEAEEIIRMRTRLNKILSDATGQPLSKVEADTERNHWLTAAEAISYGIAGRIIMKSSEV